MTDTNKYRIVYFDRLSGAYPRSKQGEPFETREALVKWIAKNGPSGIKRITFNNKCSCPGRTGWVDVETLLGLWKEVEIERRKLAQALP